jgi:hypothetical protein
MNPMKESIRFYTRHIHDDTADKQDAGEAITTWRSKTNGLVCWAAWF